MKGFELALFALVAAAVVCNAAAQDGCTLDSVTNSRLTTLLMTGLGLDEEPSVTEFTIFCGAAGRIQGRFRELSVAVEYNGGVVSTVDLVCDEATDEFNLPTGYLGISDVTSPTEQAFLLNPANIVTNCARCVDPDSGTVTFVAEVDDERRHCLRCDDECLFSGLSQCYGSSSSECCNVYLSSVCMNQCPDNYVTDDNSICQCNITCMNGGTPNDDCTGCNCLENFSGDNCEECVLAYCETCSQVDGVCLVCYDGFLLTDNGKCVIDCTECDTLTDITERNVCTYFCQLAAWTEEALACGLNIPNITSPNFSVRTPEELQELATEAAEVADGAWTDEATALSLDVEAPVYGSTLAEWREGIRQHILNIQDWQMYVLSTLDSSFPVKDFSSLLQDIGTRSDIEVYDELQNCWLLLTNAFTNRIALDQCPV